MLYNLIKSFLKSFIILFVLMECLLFFQSESHLNSTILKPYKESISVSKLINVQNENLHHETQTSAIMNNENKDEKNEKQSISYKQKIYYFIVIQ